MSTQANPGVAAVVVLAAGAGTRMRSATPKVLHPIGGRSLLGHVVVAGRQCAPAELVVVVGGAAPAVPEHLAAFDAAARVVVQPHPGGTGEATELALAALPDLQGTVVVVPGDTPLLRGATLRELVRRHTAARAAATLLTAEVADPSGYGRVLRGPDGVVTGVVEHRDASSAQLSVREVATSVYAFDAALLRDALHRVGTDNAQGERYLPDVIGVLVAAGRPVGAWATDSTEVAGVNDRVQLARAGAALRDRVLEAHMLAGVTVVDPATTWMDVTVAVEPDVVLEPGTRLHGSTVLARGASVGPDVTLTDTVVGVGARVRCTTADGAVIGAGVDVGPYAYLRPGTRLRDRSKVGTFVEVKNADLGEGAKVPHLTYVGDATIGEGSNIGASSVFVNYDGVRKHRTVVGRHARTGSDTMFVAPVTVGDGAYTAAGSVITDDVPPGAMAVARARQRNIEGWVARRRPGTPSAQAAAARACEAVPDSDSAQTEQGERP